MDQEKTNLEENIRNFLLLCIQHSKNEQGISHYIQKPQWLLKMDQDDETKILEMLNDKLKRNINMRLQPCSCPPFIICKCCDTFLNTLIMSWNSLFYEQNCIYYYLLVSNS